MGLPSVLFLPCALAKSLYTRVLSPIRATFPTHLILLDSYRSISPDPRIYL